MTQIEDADKIIQGLRKHYENHHLSATYDFGGVTEYLQQYHPPKDELFEKWEKYWEWYIQDLNSGSKHDLKTVCFEKLKSMNLLRDSTAPTDYKAYDVATTKYFAGPDTTLIDRAIKHFVDLEWFNRPSGDIVRVLKEIKAAGEK